MLDFPMEAAVIDVDDEHLVGAYCGLLVLWWGARTMPDKVARVRDQARVFVQERTRMAVLVVVEPNSELPNKESRKILEEMTHLMLRKTVALCYVFEGSGIRASATRTLMTALMLVGPPSKKVHKVVNTLDQALDWFVPYLADREFGTEVARRAAVRSFEKTFNDFRAGKKGS